MAGDARVIPIDGGDGRRKGRRPASSAADAVAAAAERAGGERAARRSGSPLLEGANPAQEHTAATATTPRRRRPAAARAQGRTSDHPAPGHAVRTGDLDVAGAVDESRGSGADWEHKVAEVLAFLRRRLTGDYPVDDFGFDPDLNDRVLMAAARPLYERYFRVEARGLENVPSDGSALIVANHSGTIPVDALMTQLALLDHHPARRHLRMLGADLVFTLPVVGSLARKSGTTLACNEDAERLLRGGEIVGVWPEGFKGIGKPFSERYKLQRFGRGGFVSAALRAKAPIVPCSIVGAEEIYPIIGNMRTLARLFGLPYVPVTPTFPWLGPLGAIPLPSKWIIEFGDPIETADLDDSAADDPMLVFDLTDRVRETIQHTLYKLLVQRRSVFF
jgi:1-acyl-sn-glycerol-3-phosphate acyltransferase